MIGWRSGLGASLTLIVFRDWLGKVERKKIKLAMKKKCVITPTKKLKKIKPISPTLIYPYHHHTTPHHTTPHHTTPHHTTPHHTTPHHTTPHHTTPHHTTPHHTKPHHTPPHHTTPHHTTPHHTTPQTKKSTETHAHPKVEEEA